MNKLIFLINEAARNWEQTRDPKYKKEWYDLLKEYSRNTYPKRENRGIGFKGEKSDDILS